MSKKIRILAVALALSILAGVAGCSGKETTKKSTKKPKKTTTEETDDPEVDPPTEDTDVSNSGGDTDATSDPSDTDISDSSSNTGLVPTDTSDSDSSDPSGSDSGSGRIYPGNDDPDLPGSPCRDSARGKISRDLYEEFLLGNEKIDASYFGEYKDYSYMMSIPNAEVPTDKLSLEEIIQFVTMHLVTQRDDIEPFVQYAFIDAGLDGDPELALCINGLGDFRLETIIKCIDGELYLTAALDAWTRNDVYIYRTGYVETDGSAGFNSSLQDMGVIDENGKYTVIANQALCNDSYATLDERLQPLTDYTDGHLDEKGNIVVVRMMFGDDETIYSATTFDYVLGRSAEQDVSDGAKKVLDEIDGMEFIPIDELLEIMREHFPDGVLDSSMAEYIYLST